ncbi:uncharacterized protein [Montipora capricornis]|uniref:uncharacterized protein n=1 Tax=Montipora capricornis TaxID=246305 RepID=UPI0035F112D4
MVQELTKEADELATEVETKHKMELLVTPNAMHSKSREKRKEIENEEKNIDGLQEKLKLIFSVCEDENKKLRNENKILQKTLNKVDISLKSVTKANNDLEQYTRRECVEIRGVPQKPDESTNTIVKEVGKAVGVEISDIDISVSHHLPPSKLYKNRKPGPPPIIVKFVRRDTKSAFYQARTKLKDMTSKALGFPDENRMYISESLSPANRVLFNEAYKLKKDLDYKFHWTSNGRVFLRATEASSVISIHSLDFVKKIRNQNGRSRPEESVAQGQNL